MKQEWKVGDVVQLKSGGPDMTVIHVSGDAATVTCAWSTKTQRQTVHRQTFPAAAVTASRGLA